MGLGKTKISQFDLKVLSNKNIGKFKVSVDYPMVPDDSECPFQLDHDLPYLFLWKYSIGMLVDVYI